MKNSNKSIKKAIARKNSDKSFGGFTIIELLIATTVFSVVLLVFLTAFVRVSELFYKGINMDNTQEAARTVIQDISSDLQFDQGSYNLPADPNANYFCVGIHRYTWSKGVQVGIDGGHGIDREVVGSGCPSLEKQGVNYATADELLDPGMQANNLSVNCGNSICTVAIHIVFYGNDNSVLISPSGQTPAYKAADAQCSGGVESSQYCATADYKSTVLQKF